MAIAVALVIIWAATGHYFDYSDGWQLVINTGTTIVTFLMAFLIQATQFRESKAINLKIDELLRAIEGARTGFVNIDKLTDAELEALAAELHKLGKATQIVPLRAAAAATACIADALKPSEAAPVTARKIPRKRARRAARQ